MLEVLPEIMFFFVGASIGYNIVRALGNLSSKLMGSVSPLFASDAKPSQAKDGINSAGMLQNFLEDYGLNENSTVIALAVLLIAYLIYAAYRKFWSNQVGLFCAAREPRCGEDIRRHVCSPVDICLANATRIAACSGDLVFENWKSSPTDMNLYNDGNNAIITGDWDCPPTISGNALGGREFEFSHIKFVWGESNDAGSEHSLNGEYYAMEIQLVFANVNTCDVRVPVAIISVFAELVNGCRGGFVGKFARQLNRICESHSETCIDEFPLSDVVKSFGKNFSEYSGMWAEGENAIYIISPEKTKVTCQQLDAFRNLHNDCGERITDNRRGHDENSNPEINLYT